MGRRGDGQRQREVGGRLRDAHPTHRRREHVEVGQLHPAATLDDGVDHGDPLAVQPADGPPRIPAADLALALAIASAASDTPLPAGLIALGEVGLSGEIRRVGGTGRRLAEAARQGYKVALVPPDAGAAPPGMRLVEIPDLGAAFARLF